MDSAGKAVDVSPRGGEARVLLVEASSEGQLCSWTLSLGSGIARLHLCFDLDNRDKWGKGTIFHVALVEDSCIQTRLQYISVDGAVSEMAHLSLLNPFSLDRVAYVVAYPIAHSL